MKSKELYPAIFGRHAAAYQKRLEDVMSRGEARGRIRAIELVQARPDMRILDLACGPGTLTRLLAARVAPGGEVVGVDLAPEMIELARNDAPVNTRFEVMDIERLAFADASFDAALCGHGLQFVPDLEQALREARRVVRPPGVLAASVPVAGIRETVWAVIDTVVDRWLPPAPEVPDNKTTRATVRDGESLATAAREAGFASAAVEPIEEVVVWESPEQLVSMFMGWWDFAYRIDAIDGFSRQAFADEATEAIRNAFPGAIETRGRTLVLLAKT